MRYLSDDDLKNTRPAEDARLRSPIPTSNLRYGYVAKARSR